MPQETRHRIVNRSKKLKKRYLSLVHLDTEGKGHESFEKTMSHGIIYMEKCNLVPIINHQIKSKYVKRTGPMQRVFLRGTCSSWSPVLSGVPQGTILGPVLFILYVNDISSGISSTVKLYADDTKVYREISDIARDTSILQSDLFHLRNWSEVWH